MGSRATIRIFVPITTFDKYYPDRPFPEVVFFIIVRPQSRAYVKSAIDEITDILRRRRRVPLDAPNNFGISSQDSLLDIYNQLTGATALVLTAISFVALMIGGIGVMNIMLVSVTERTKEIGVRKAVGATRLNILSQFLIEAVVLTAIGGLAGLAVGELLAFLINQVFAAAGLCAAVGHRGRHWHFGRRWESSLAYGRRGKPRGSIRSKRCAGNNVRVTVEAPVRQEPSFTDLCSRLNIRNNG